MDKKMMKDGLDIIDAHFKEEGISRRDALKLMGTGGAAALMATSTTGCTGGSSDAKGKILIVGGGLAGVSTAARLTNSLSNPDITIIEPNESSVSYQPGQTLVGAGIWENADTTYKTADHMPSGVTWIKEKAVEFDPDNNTVTVQF